jgi:cellulose binding protein with CBM2 domain/GDSL-like lipase/acylhydrolase family protein/carbohydrate esterase-like protein
MRRRLLGAVLVASAVLLGWSHPLRAQAAAGDGTPGDPNISFVGRWNRTNASAYVPYWAGAYLRVGFTGRTVKLKQRNTIDLWASIDGRAFTAFSGSGTINLTPTALAAGNHTLIVSYRQVAGSYTGDAVFQGLTLDSGAVTFKAPARPRLLEFVGDSITAGTTSSQLAVTDYGFRTGEQLGYDHTQIAIGGMCLSETTDGCWAHETRYWMSSGGQAGTDLWDFSRYTADGVVINLGTNDKSHGVSSADFQAKYINFLTRIRARFPNAKLFAMRTFIGRYAAETQAAVRARNSAGDAGVYYVDTTGWLPPDGLSDSVHPNDKGHQAITDKLAPIIGAALATTSTPTTAPTTAPTSACTVTYRTTGDWGTGAQFDVTITSAAAVNGWTLTWTLPAGQTITQSWNATTSQSGTAARAVNAAWNVAIPAGGTASFGLIADNALGGATGFALNDAPCTATSS